MIFIRKFVQLLLQAMVETHAGSNIFQRSGEFPNGTDPEYPVALATFRRKIREAECWGRISAFAIFCEPGRI
jgi:hypothetical protein